MDKYIHNEQNGLWYELQGEYYLPCLKLPEEPEVHIGIWGQRHRRYLKGHHKALYTSLLTSGKLNSYLADIDRQAEEMFSRLVKQLSEKEVVTEAIKAENQRVKFLCGKSVASVEIRVDFDAYHNAGSSGKIALTKDMLLTAAKRIKTKVDFDYDRFKDDLGSLQ